VGPAVATTEAKEDIDEGPLGVVQAGPTTPTTIVEEVVDGGPPGGCCWRVQHQPPSKLKETLMAGPWVVLPVGPATTEADGEVDGIPAGGAAGRSANAYHRC
jgi:hypothetical protein